MSSSRPLCSQQTQSSDHSSVPLSHFSQRKIRSALLNSSTPSSHSTFSQMYNNLGIHWASMIPAFLALACVPFPFVLYKYGPAIRTRCKYAAEVCFFTICILEAIS